MTKKSENHFENLVEEGLLFCNISLSSVQTIGAAVSGGADSVALLISLCNLLKPHKIPLKVITVNHNIRPEAETTGDAIFVQQLCKQLNGQNYNVECTLVTLDKGQVESFAKEKKSGIEDAARELRYSAFENFIREEKIDFLCLAHNKNDQLETLLMRFLQGAGTSAATGIPAVRGKIIRPLLNISRSEIESYLTEKKCSWRTDNTNFDTNYLRNRIRHNLIPVLNENFEGWQSSVLKGARKLQSESEIIEKMVNQSFEELDLPSQEKNGFFEINHQALSRKPPVLQQQILLRCMNLLGCSQRIPYDFLEDVLSCSKGEKQFDDIQIIFKKDVVLVKKVNKSHTDLNFSVIIEEDGFYHLPFGTVEVLKENESSSKHSVSVNNKLSELKVSLPVCIRNLQCDDYIKTADGKLKKVNKVFSDWHVPSEKKELIPLIQELQTSNQELICILGSAVGFKDWVVKN